MLRGMKSQWGESQISTVIEVISIESLNELSKVNGLESLSGEFDGSDALDTKMFRIPLDPGKCTLIARKVRDVIRECSSVAVLISDSDIWNSTSESMQQIFSRGLGLNIEQLYKPLLITGIDRQLLDAILLYSIYSLRDLLILPHGLGYFITFSHDEFLDLHGKKESYSHLNKWLAEFLS
jgi:hypothetical protein